MLNLIGLDLGPEDGFMPPGRGNPQGFWEQREISQLNQELIDGKVIEPRNPPPGWAASEELAPQRARARALLDEMFATSNRWGWKDPKNSLTLPFWQLLLPEMQYVICVRNPIDVLASIKSWTRQPATEQWRFVWRQFMASSIANTAGRRRIFVTYEDHIDDSQATAGRLARFVGCNPPSPECERQISDLIECAPRRRSTPPEAVLHDEQISQDAAWLYLMARELAACEALGDSGREATGLETITDLYAGWLLGRGASPQGV